MRSHAATAAPVAVILVAGVGERLRPLTERQPKALVSIGTETLLGRATRLLIDHGVQEIVLATGYQESAVRDASSACGVPVRCCLNPNYATTQNSISLLACAQAVGGRAFYKLDGDVVFEAQVLQRLDAAGAPLAVAVDARAALGEEEMKVRIDRRTRHIVAFGKGLDPTESHGESIGIERVDEGAAKLLFRGLSRAAEAGRTDLYYEDVYGQLIGEGLQAVAVDVSDLCWAEVDTLEDLERARRMVVSAAAAR